MSLARRSVHKLRLADMVGVTVRSTAVTTQGSAALGLAARRAVSTSSGGASVVPTVVQGLTRSALACAGVNLFGFAATALTGTHKLTDLCGTGAFVVSMLSTAKHSGAWKLGLASTAGVLNSMLGAWGVRLGTYLFARILYTGKARRW